MPLFIPNPSRLCENELVVSTHISPFVLRGHPEDVRFSLILGHYQQHKVYSLIRPTFQLSCYLDGRFKLYPCLDTPEILIEEDDLTVEGIVTGQINPMCAYESRQYLKLVARYLWPKYRDTVYQLAMRAF